jgi:hypothetical protein
MTEQQRIQAEIELLREKATFYSWANKQFFTLFNNLNRLSRYYPIKQGDLESCQISAEYYKAKELGCLDELEQLQKSQRTV